MSVRKSTSSKSKWHISPNRFLELKYHCLQVPEWEREIGTIMMNIGTQSGEKEGFRHRKSDPNFPNWNEIVHILELEERIELIYETCEVCGENWYKALYDQIIHQRNYEYLLAHYEIPYSKSSWYRNYYRKFFWLLDRQLKEK